MRVIILKQEKAHFTDINWVYNFYEASKIRADRNQYLADPDFCKTTRVGLLNDKYLDGRKISINESAALTTPVAPE